MLLIESLLPPLNILEDSTLLESWQASQYLGLRKETLSIWRSTGRYNLRYIKVGRLVRYTAGDLKAFIASRMRNHTGDGGAS